VTAYYSAIASCASSAYGYYGDAIVVDAQGHVASVGQYSGLDEGGSCVVEALANETFPCVSGDTFLQVPPTPLR
jgi:hypothetical protein